MCTSLSKSLTKSIYTLDIVGKFLSSMEKSLQQEYLYLNIAHAFFFKSIAEGIARLYSKHVKDKSVWREYSNSIVNV